MSSIVVAGDTSGSITLSAPAIAGSTTLTLPSISGTVAIAGPAFSARSAVSQSISNNTYTKVVLGTEDYDTNNNFASSRFTPTVAGYYQFNVIVGSTGSSLVQQLYVQLYKNAGGFDPALFNINPSAAYVSNGVHQMGGSLTMYLNGGGDFIELYVYVYNAGITIGTGYNAALLTGTFVRAS